RMPFQKKQILLQLDKIYNSSLPQEGLISLSGSFSFYPERMHTAIIYHIITPTDRSRREWWAFYSLRIFVLKRPVTIPYCLLRRHSAAGDHFLRFRYSLQLFLIYKITSYSDILRIDSADGRYNCMKVCNDSPSRPASL